MIHSIDDLWLASYLMSQGAKLAGVSILPCNGASRMRAVFELTDVPAGAISDYGNGDPLVAIHKLRTAINELRDLMYEALQKRNGNGSIKQMPNGNEPRRHRENENRSVRNR